jgi:hypothetical protein
VLIFENVGLQTSVGRIFGHGRTAPKGTGGENVV